MKMKHILTILIVALAYGATGCSDKKLEEKGFQVSPASASDETDETNETDNTDSIVKDSVRFATRPSNVLLTGIPNVRLTTIYKVNLNKKNNKTFIGTNRFHYRYDESETDDGNNWNDNLMPGLKAVYGYNMVNISHYDIQTNKQRNFFASPVLIRTLYYPTFSKDTLNNNPVNRNYFIVSAYNDDTNKDGFINLKDLRRMFLFDINGDNQQSLIPQNYSIYKSEYDPDNDFMYIFAQLDTNNNGQQDEGEPTHIFWIDLKDPHRTGRQY